VVKLFFPDASERAVDRETSVAAALVAAGVPAPAYLGPVDVGGRRGLVFERVQGVSMLETVGRQPWRTVSLALLLAELHAAVHRGTADLEPQRDFLRRHIGRAAVPETVRERALAAVDRLPVGDRVCHGDFHPDNVVLTATGPVVLDWANATLGAPVGDVARTLLLFRDGALPDEVPAPKRALFQAIRRLAAAVYLRRYARLTGLRTEELSPWRLPLVVARLAENVPDVERRRFLAEAEAALLQ
jgi:aminoglycoside phosphotransferase (APT) family kinase protein